MENLKDSKKEEMLKNNTLEIQLKIDVIDKKILLRSTSGERNLNSTPKSLSTTIQRKETQLLVVSVNYRKRKGWDMSRNARIGENGRNGN